MPGRIPRGVEILITKAAVDPEFKALLLARRAAAAQAIDLALTPAEAAVVDSIPEAQLDASIANTVVSPMTRGAFLGTAASAMIAALARAAADDPMGRGRPRRYHVCEVKDYKGDLRYEVLDRTLHAERLAALRRSNPLLGPAHREAARLWRADRARAGLPFPMAEPRPEQCRILGSYARRDLAQAELRTRQERLARDRKARDAKEAKRRQALAPEERKQAQRKADQIEAAHRLFQDSLRKLLARRPAGLGPGRIIVIHGFTVDDLERD